MTGAAKGKSLPASLAAARVLLLLVVALLLGQTRVWGFAAPPQPAPGEIAPASPSSVGEITTAWAYDAPDSLLAANSGGKLYHYTGEANVAGILEKGLVPGRASGKVWTTSNGTLTPTQAQIELALSPNRGLPGAMLEIDAAALQRAGIKPSLGPIRVQPTPNAPGGGIETIFDQAIPPEFIRRAR